MGDQSAIEWTEATWNPIVGCSRVSEGCRHCYAERQAYRAEAMGIPQYEGITKKVGSEIRWTGKVALVESALALPLRWKRPRRIFVNSMSDLFHESVPDEWIDRIFSVMALAPQHTFQVLTKRPERMRAYLRDSDTTARWLIHIAQHGALAEKWAYQEADAANWMLHGLLNVWLGVSVEDQPTFSQRWNILRQVPAAVRFLSMEPLLGPIDMQSELWEDLGPFIWPDWIITGGESGPGARPCDLSWIRSIVAQARSAGVPVFVKQFGARPIVAETDFGQLGEYVRCSEDGSNEVRFRDRKGGDPAEWPDDLRVREYPACAQEATRPG